MHHKNNIFKIAVCALLLIVAQGCSSHANYPVTREVDWIPEEHVQWEVLELSAKFEHQDFNLFNRSSHIVIQARLKVHGRTTSTYKIDRLHISQRFVEEPINRTESISLNIPGAVIRAYPLYRDEYVKANKTDKINFAVVDIQPIFELDQKLVNAEAKVIAVRIREPIANLRYGRNFYRVILGDKHIDLGTHQ